MIPAFSACTESPEPGIRTSTHLVGDAHHLDLALAGADRLEEDDVLAGRVEQQQRLERRLGQPAEVPARPHRADEHAGIEEVVDEADPVAEQRALRERARRIDRDDADRQLEAPNVPDERSDQRGLADARRAGDTDRERGPGLRVELLDDAPGRRDRDSRRARSSARAPGGRPPARRRRAARGSRDDAPSAPLYGTSTSLSDSRRRMTEVVGSSRMLGQFTAQFAIVRVPEHRALPESPARPADLGARHLDGVLRRPDRALQPDELRLVGQHPALLRARPGRDPRHRCRAR